MANTTRLSFNTTGSSNDRITFKLELWINTHLPYWDRLRTHPRQNCIQNNEPCCMVGDQKLLWLMNITTSTICPTFVSLLSKIMNNPNIGFSYFSRYTALPGMKQSWTLRVAVYYCNLNFEFRSTLGNGIHDVMPNCRLSFNRPRTPLTVLWHATWVPTVEEYNLTS